jgi:hypothetical protein
MMAKVSIFLDITNVFPPKRAKNGKKTWEIKKNDYLCTRFSMIRITLLRNHEEEKKA